MLNDNEVGVYYRIVLTFGRIVIKRYRTSALMTYSNDSYTQTSKILFCIAFHKNYAN